MTTLFISKFEKLVDYLLVMLQTGKANLETEMPPGEYQFFRSVQRRWGGGCLVCYGLVLFTVLQSTTHEARRLVFISL